MAFYRQSASLLNCAIVPLVALMCLTSCAATPPPVTATTSSALPRGDGSFTFSGWAGRPLRVWYHLPEQITAATPVVIVMHGAGRDAQGYRNAWTPHAASQRFILVVPEFPETDFPGSDTYNNGHMFGADGRARPREQWTFAAVEPLFDEIKRRAGSRVPSYAIYGHSAGGQFVHRFVMMMPQARYRRAIAANAGWYTMPNLDVPYPYGLKGTHVDRAMLSGAFGKPLTVLLGTADTDPNHSQLRRTPEAMAQGPHRLARGQTFYAASRSAAERVGVPFRWKLRYAEGAAHTNTAMAASAAPLLRE